MERQESNNLFMGGDIEIEDNLEVSKSKYGPTMLYLGLTAIIFVPIFKTVTHLPPYVGMMLSLAVVGVFAEVFSRSQFSISHAIDVDGDDCDV